MDKKWINISIINPDQVPLTEPYYNLQQVIYYTFFLYLSKLNIS